MGNTQWGTPFLQHLVCGSKASSRLNAFPPVEMVGSLSHGISSIVFSLFQQMPYGHESIASRVTERIIRPTLPLINFQQHRNTVAAMDIKRPPSRIVRVMNPVLRTWEAYLRPFWLHRLANSTVQDLIRREDDNTSYNDLAPVKKALQMVTVHFIDGNNRDSLAKHREKLPTYLWQSEEGMTSSGTNSVQVWDTASTILAVVEAGLFLDPRFNPLMIRALVFLEMSQLSDDPQDPYRQQRKG